MGENELTHLVGGGILAILVLDRVTNLVRVVLGKKNGEAQPSHCQTLQHVEALTKATEAGFAAQRADNAAIRDNLHKISNVLAPIVTGIAILQDRSHREGV